MKKLNSAIEALNMYKFKLNNTSNLDAQDLLLHHIPFLTWIKCNSDVVTSEETSIQNKIPCPFKLPND